MFTYDNVITEGLVFFVHWCEHLLAKYFVTVVICLINLFVNVYFRTDTSQKSVRKETSNKVKIINKGEE